MLGGVAVEGVESEPVAEFVCVFYDGFETFLVCFCPIAGAACASGFDSVPGIVPPSVVVSCGFVEE